MKCTGLRAAAILSYSLCSPLAPYLAHCPSNPQARVCGVPLHLLLTRPFHVASSISLQSRSSGPHPCHSWGSHPPQLFTGPHSLCPEPRPPAPDRLVLPYLAAAQLLAVTDAAQRPLLLPSCILCFRGTHSAAQTAGSASHTAHAPSSAGLHLLLLQLSLPPPPRAPETIPLHLAMQLRPISSLQCWRPPPPTPPCRQRHWLLFARCPDFQVLMTTIECSPFLMCTGFDILFQEMRNILVTERVLTQTRFLLKSGKYLEIPNCHGSIDASSAKFATILLVHLINRHLTEKKQKQETLSGMWREWAPTFLANSVRAF